jgi:hypothetical protein
MAKITTKKSSGGQLLTLNLEKKILKSPPLNLIFKGTVSRDKDTEYFLPSRF